MNDNCVSPARRQITKKFNDGSQERRATCSNGSNSTNSSPRLRGRKRSNKLKVPADQPLIYQTLNKVYMARTSSADDLVDFGSKARVKEVLNQAKDTGRDDGQKCLNNQNKF